MIAIISQIEDWTAVDSCRQLQFTPTSVDFGYRLRGLIRTVSCNLERRFAAFADVPYHDLFCRHDWEQLWETGLWDPPHRAYRLRRISRTPQPQPYSASRYESSSDTNVQLFRIPKF